MTLNPSEAGFMEPLATVIHGAKKLRLKPFETVVVIGAGTMGLINARQRKLRMSCDRIRDDS